jgi:integrase
LTQSFVDKQAFPAGKRKVNVKDTQVIGLLLELRESGGKTWYVRYTDDRGKRFQHKLGDAQVLKLSQARQLALEIKAKVLMDESPTGQKRIARQVPTLAAFVAEHYMPYVKVHKRSWITDEILLRCHVLPHVGHKPLDQITKAELIALFHAHRQTHKPASTNRVMHLLRYVYNLALEWEIPGLKENPTKGIRQFQENNKRERYLTPEEAKRLFQAIESSPNPLPKAGEARHVPLSEQTLTLLASRREATDSPWIFANPRTGKPFKSVFHSWDSARQQRGGHAAQSADDAGGHDPAPDTHRRAHHRHPGHDGMSTADTLGNVTLRPLPTGRLFRIRHDEKPYFSIM